MLSMSVLENDKVSFVVVCLKILYNNIVTVNLNKIIILPQSFIIKVGQNCW